MAYLYLFAILQVNASLEANIRVAKGKETVIPTSFIALEELDQLAIKQSYWAKVKISNTQDGVYVLSGGKRNLNKINFYSTEGLLLGQGNNLEIRLNGNDTTYLLFYPFVDEKDSKLLSISIDEKTTFLEKEKSESIKQYIFQAFLLFPLLVSAVLYLRTRAVVYLHYVLYIFSIMCFFAYQYGILGTFFSAINNVPPIWIWLFGSLLSIFYLLFTISFLDLKNTDPFSRKLILIAIWFTNFYTVLSISLYAAGIDVQHSLLYKAPFLSGQVVLILWFIIRIFHHPSSIKYYYLTGFFILFAILISGQVLSTSRSASDYNHLFQIGLVAEVFILTLGLTARISAIRRDKDIAQNKLIEQLKVNEELQKEYTEELEDKLSKRTKSLDLRNKEYEMLLKEVHHRVKNNLQMIISMINMHKRRSDSDEVEEVLTGTRNKIKSMALIHEHLYSHEDFANVALDEYLTCLIEMIIDSLHKGNTINQRFKMENIVSDIQTSISVGLILNELVTNCIKYALSSHPEPALEVEIKERKSELIIKVQDNGRSAAKVLQDGLGYTIVKSILDNMSGSMVQKPSSEGYQVEIRLKDYQLTA